MSRPYRFVGKRFDAAELGALSAADDATVFALLLERPDWVAPDVVFVADGRVVPGSDVGVRSVLGWHRAGGPVLVAVTTGTAGSRLLVEVTHLADATKAWGLEQWEEAIRSYWSGVSVDLKERVARRWQLSSEPWRLEAWTRAAWGESPELGDARVALMGGEVEPRVARAVAWMASEGREAAAFAIRRVRSGEATTLWTECVAGGWRVPLVGPEQRSETAALRRDLYVHHTGGITAGLLAAIESRCVALGSRVAWSGEDWVRFEGGRHALRVFPGPGWVDLQLIGIDEGTLKGLAFRFDLLDALDLPDDAPPGVHLRLKGEEEYTGALDLLLSAWLGEGSGEGDAEPAQQDPTVHPLPVSETPDRSRSEEHDRGRS